MAQAGAITFFDFKNRFDKKSAMFLPQLAGRFFNKIKPQLGKRVVLLRGISARASVVIK